MKENGMEQDLEYANRVFGRREDMDDREVAEWMDDESHLETIDMAALFHEVLSPQDFSGMKNDVMKGLAVEPVRKRRRGALIGISAATVAAGVILAAIFVPESNREMPSAEIAPGSYRAELTLLNGELLLLPRGGESIDGDRPGLRIDPEEGLVFTDPATLPDTDTNAFNVLKTPRGGEYNVVLPDGSKIWLNAESELRFSTFKREVHLIGEAYFEVAKDAARPFIVHTGGVAVEVLGTDFGVRAYPDEDMVLTTLVEGSVVVSTTAGKKILTPSQQAVSDPATGTTQVAQVDTDLFVGWKSGRLVFNNTPFELVMKELARWYNFDVVYENPELRAIRISLNTMKYATFDRVLELIGHTGKISFKVAGNTVTVK